MHTRGGGKFVGNRTEGSPSRCSRSSRVTSAEVIGMPSGLESPSCHVSCSTVSMGAHVGSPQATWREEGGRVEGLECGRVGKDKSG